MIIQGFVIAIAIAIALKCHNRTMRFARRIISAFIMTIAAAGAIRVKGRGGTPPRHGGWRPIRIRDTEGENW